MLCSINSLIELCPTLFYVGFCFTSLQRDHFDRYRNTLG
jgi:hypothetical protein